MAKIRYALLISLGTLAAAPAMAQNAAQPATPAATATPGAAAPTFITQAPVGQYRASKLVGVEIYNGDNQDIGEVADLVVDKDGAVQAVVIGVGGFLGIGEKNVALPYKAIKWEDKAPAASSVGMNTNTTTGAAPQPPVVPDTTVRDYPDHGLLNMTKDQLKAAPDFKYASESVK